jgi:hypothetical protein
MTMSNLPAINEMIGIFVAVVMALGLVTLLLYIRGTEAGLSRSKVRRAVIALWTTGVITVIALLALRSALGGPVAGGTPRTGFWIEDLPRAGLLILGAAVAVVIAAMIVLWHVLRDFQNPPVQSLEPDPGPSPDEPC